MNEMIVFLCWAQVDDKYQYSCENKVNTVHGWISVDAADAPPVGFWMITPSSEFRNAGPIKQDLTSHVGPITLSVCPNIFLNQNKRNQTKQPNLIFNPSVDCVRKVQRFLWLIYTFSL